jgi:hypothetical protein
VEQSTRGALTDCPWHTGSSDRSARSLGGEAETQTADLDALTLQARTDMGCRLANCRSCEPQVKPVLHKDDA